MKVLRQFAVFMLIIGAVLGLMFAVFRIPEVLAAILALAMTGYFVYSVWQLAGMYVND